MSRRAKRAAVAGAVLVTLAAGGAWWGGARWGARWGGARYVPDAALPDSETAIRARGADLAARYPDDPRARFFHAVALSAQGDRANARRELEAALDARDALRTRYADGNLEAAVRTLLAQLLAGEGREAEARDVARPVCARGAAPPPGLTALGLCAR